MAKSPRTKSPSTKKPADKKPVAKQARDDKGRVKGPAAPAGTAKAKEYASKARAAIRWPAHPFARRFHKPSDLEHELAEYFENAEDVGRPLTWGGLAHYLGMTIHNLDAYMRGERGDNDKDRAEFREVLSMAKEVIMVSKQEHGLMGKYNTNFVIFDLKNNHGWKDKTEQALTGPDGMPIRNELTVTFRKSRKTSGED